MRLYRAAEMREADARAVSAGVSSAQLMERAGAAVAREVLRRYPGSRGALVLCGAGNNGGDGYVCARKLREAGLDVSVLELSEEPGKADAAAARAALVAAGARPSPLVASTDLASLVGPGSVIVDALLGSGLDRPVTGWLGELLPRLAGLGAPVVAVDVPSGLSTDAPRPIGAHVTADLTVELAGHKVAGAFYPARALYGERVLAPIGIPAAELEAAGSVVLLDAEVVRRWLPRRPPDAHKYVAGSVTVVAGSGLYAGAAELACRGAWRAGAGLVTLLGPEQHVSAWPETIFERLGAQAGAEAALERAVSGKRAAALVVGPGLDERLLPLLPDLVGWARGAVVLDAAAITPAALTREARSRVRAHGGIVVTPHAGEAAAILGTSADAVTADPLAAAAALTDELGAVAVLKGATTVVAAPDGRSAVSTRGHPGMASGGTGDVLAGVLGALLAPVGGREAVFERACAAVWSHGRAGEAAAEGGGMGLVASDVAEALPLALAELEE